LVSREKGRISIRKKAAINLALMLELIRVRRGSFFIDAPAFLNIQS
jgi:hypothetical protein